MAMFSTPKQQLNEADRVIQLLQLRIQQLERELARAHQMSIQSPGAKYGAHQMSIQSPGAEYGAHRMSIQSPGAEYAVATPGSAKLSPSAAPYTPTAKQTGRRHKRTETPLQLFLKPLTPMKMYTMGMEPQNDRGLLHDFFDDIRKWAIHYTIDLDAQEVARCSSFGDLVDMMGGKSDLQHMLADREMRQDMVTALAIRDIVVHAIGEGSMFNSKHHNGQQCRDLVSEFAMLSQDDHVTKHQLCVQQAILYKTMYEEHDHKEWRTEKAEERTKMLLCILAPFLHADINADREHSLGELYVKGYRIGLRLRSKAVKWQVIFPVAGMQLDLRRMVNRTLNLAGDPTSTLMEIMEQPSKFFVRFAMSPTICKSDFSTGSEIKEVVHSSMVHIGRENNFSHKKDVKFTPVKTFRKN